MASRVMQHRTGRKGERHSLSESDSIRLLDGGLANLAARTLTELETLLRRRLTALSWTSASMAEKDVRVLPERLGPRRVQPSWWWRER